MLDVVQRYYPAVKQFNKALHKRIIDVGCGNLGGIAPFVDVTNNEVALYDDDLGDYRLEKVTYHKGSILNMPFASESYDFTICIDVLEHLPANLRNDAVKELLRITNSKLIIAFPEGELSVKSDKLVCTVFEKITRKKHIFLREHAKYGLPEQTKILSAIKKYSPTAEVKTERQVNINVWILTVFISLFISAITICFDRYIGKRRFSLTNWTERILFFSFGWTIPFLDFGPFYRTAIIVEKVHKRQTKLKKYAQPEHVAVPAPFPGKDLWGGKTPSVSRDG
jgi:SAM-dependent methyltransferase